MNRAPIRGWGLGICATVLAAIAVSPRTAQGQVDMNGPWFADSFLGPQTFSCDLNFTQVGTSLTIAGTCEFIDAVSVSGTIDAVTGNFSGGAGTAGVECPTLTLTLGLASLDNRTFFAGFVCNGGPSGGFQFALNGRRCGNGVIDAITAEECDPVLTNFQCCTTDMCQLAPAGSGCFDGNNCTDDACDGAGTCVSTNNTDPCDDFNQCTVGDTCAGGSCVGTIQPDDTPCEDFNDCTDETCQSGSCTPTDKPDGTPCDDFFDCLVGETCLGGDCQLGDPPVCASCQRCYEGEGCVPDANPNGYSCQSSLEGTLLLKNRAPDSLKWKWVTGASDDPLDLAEFGDPTTPNTPYEFCIFDSSFETPNPRLLFGMSIPSGSGWSQTPKSFSYKAADKSKVRVKAGAASKGHILVKARGGAHDIQPLSPIVLPLEVQIRTAEGVVPQRCFVSLFSTPSVSTEEKFKAEDQ